MPKPPGRTALYRLYDASDQLLYVGITNNLERRWREHRRDRRDTWWPDVTHKVIEWLPSRRAAQAVERQVVQAEKPVYNVLHSPDRPTGLQTIPRPANFGDASIILIRQHFGDKPFTTLDLHAVGSRSKAGVEQHVRALRDRDLIVPVGKRSNSPRKGKRHTLFVLADSPLASSDEPILEGAGAPSQTPAMRNTSLTEGARDALELARVLFGSDAFTAADLTAAGSFSRPAVRRYVNALTHHGLLETDGYRQSPGRGHPATLFRVR